MKNHLENVMVSMHAWSTLDCGLDQWSDQIEDYNIGNCCFFPQHASSGGKNKTVSLVS